MNVDAALARFDELKVKGFLGPTLKEDTRLADLGTRAARAQGIDVDPGGKLRCADGAPGAGRFTDMQQSNCQIPLTVAERQKNSAAKKALPLTQGMVEFKAGLFHSRGRIGRALQAAGSYALPGDYSDVRHPLRSSEYEALTPGSIGGRGLRIGGPKLVRCPAGYEHGGRFSPQDLSGCGRQLFTPPHGVRTSSELTRRAGQTGERLSRASGNDIERVGLQEGETEVLRGRRSGGRAVQISRQANIAHVRPFNESSRKRGIESAVQSLKASGGSMLVRRDGTLLAPVAGASIGDMRMSRDVQQAAFVRSVRGPKNLGRSEVAELLDSPLGAVAFAFPNGDSITVSKDRELSKAQKVRLARQWNAGMSIADLEAASHGTIKVDAKIKEASSLERVWIEPINGNGASRSVPRWMFEMFLAEGAGGRVGQAWKIREDS